MKILKVLEVETVCMKSNPIKLIINAYGLVGSPGWKDGCLEQWFYLSPPSDGIQDFDFVAEKPTAIVPQVITSISAQIEWDDPPIWLVGVRVHSQSNKIQKKISDNKTLNIE
jgi:hypothetical protein